MGQHPRVFAGLKDAVMCANQALIYHMNNHYTLIVGYFEHSVDPDTAYDAKARLRRWIILGEHSEYNPIPTLVQRVMRSLPSQILAKDTFNLVMERAAGTPVWSRRWRSVRHDLINTPKHCILMFER